MALCAGAAAGSVYGTAWGVAEYQNRTDLSTVFGTGERHLSIVPVSAVKGSLAGAFLGLVAPVPLAVGSAVLLGLQSYLAWARGSRNWWWPEPRYLGGYGDVHHVNREQPGQITVLAPGPWTASKSP